MVERGSWKDDVVGEADRAWERGETDKAIVGWWMAGERGYESAQNNLAFVLDQGELRVSSRRKEGGRGFEELTLTRRLSRFDAQILLCTLCLGGAIHPTK